MALIPTLLNQIPGYKAFTGAIKSGFNTGTAMATPRVGPYLPQQQGGFVANSTSSVAKAPAVPGANLLGVKAASPQQNVKPPSNTLPASQQAPRASAPAPAAGISQNDYWLKPGESMNDYNARIAALRAPAGGGGSTGNSAQNSAPSAPQAQEGGLYGSLVRELAERSRNAGSEYQKQLAAANDINRQISVSRANQAQAQADNRLNPIPLQFQQGRDQVLQNQYLAQQNALGAQFQGATNLLSAANHQQQLQQTALGQAASLAAPQNIQYGTQYLDPTTGLPVNPQGAQEFNGALGLYAQQLASGQGGSIPGSIMSNPVLAAQVLSMAKQLNPSFNYNTAQGIGAAQQYNAQLGGTAATSANNAVFQEAYQRVAQLQNATANFDSFAQNLLETMKQGGINPTDLKFANLKLADVRRQLSSPQQAVFDSTLAALQARLTGILGAGGNLTPTEMTNDVNRVLDGSLPFSALMPVLQRIQKEGEQLLANQRAIVNNSYGGIVGGQQGGFGGGSAPSGGGTVNTAVGPVNTNW